MYKQYEHPERDNIKFCRFFAPKKKTSK